MLIVLYILAILPKVLCVVQSSNVTHLTKGCIWHEFNTSRLSKTTCDPKFSCRSFTYDTICGTRFSFKGVDLGYPKIFPSFNFFFNLHHGIVMSKYIICQSFKKFHRAVFSIAYPKYSNVGGILDARW